MTWITPPVYAPLQLMTSQNMNEISNNQNELWKYTDKGQIIYTDESDKASTLNCTTGYRTIWSSNDNWVSRYRPRIGLYMYEYGTGLSLPHNEYTLITYGNLYFDSGGFYASSSRIKIPIAGYYRINLIFAFVQNNTGFRNLYLYRYGSVDKIFFDTRAAVQYSSTNSDLNYTGYFDVDDYVETRAYQNSTVTITSAFYRRFQVMFLGA